jgi:plasmid stabilization system protein ParE
MKVEWSARALADLNRFASFLQQHFPHLAPLIARELIGKAGIIGSNPKLGSTVDGDENYRRLVVRVLNAPYVLQYRIARDRIVILRVFHGRESRDG